MMKNIINKILIITCLFLLSSCNNKISTESKNSSTIQNTNQSTKSTSQNDKQNNEKIIYEILGKSNKLTEKEKASAKKWMEDIIRVARKNPDYVFVNGDTAKKQVALTFDDGPDGRITPKVLEILKQNNVKGNFFFIGENVVKYPSVVKKAYQQGNLVLNHSYNHPDFKKENNDTVKNQILRTENEIFKIIGKKPAIIRPPYGDIDERIVKDILQTDNKVVIWSIDTLDWSQKERDNIIKNVLDNLRPGDIILMHSNGDKSETAAALPKIRSGIKEKGYEIVTLDKLLDIKAYK